MSTRYFICCECGYKFESESGKPPSEDPQACPACHSSNIMVYAVGFNGEDLVPAGGCDAPGGST